METESRLYSDHSSNASTHEKKATNVKKYWKQQTRTERIHFNLRCARVVVCFLPHRKNAVRLYVNVCMVTSICFALYEKKQIPKDSNTEKRHCIKWTKLKKSRAWLWDCIVYCVFNDDDYYSAIAHINIHHINALSMNEKKKTTNVKENIQRRQQNFKHYTQLHMYISKWCGCKCARYTCIFVIHPIENVMCVKSHKYREYLNIHQYTTINLCTKSKWNNWMP